MSITNIKVNIEPSFHKTIDIQEQNMFLNGNRDMNSIIMPYIKLEEKKNSLIRKMYKEVNRKTKATQQGFDRLTKKIPHKKNI